MQRDPSLPTIYSEPSVQPTRLKKKPHPDALCSIIHVIIWINPHTHTHAHHQPTIHSDTPFRLNSPHSEGCHRSLYGWTTWHKAYSIVENSIAQRHGVVTHMRILRSHHAFLCHHIAMCVLYYTTRRDVLSSRFPLNVSARESHPMLMLMRYYVQREMSEMKYFPRRSVCMCE